MSEENELIWMIQKSTCARARTWRIKNWGKRGEQTRQQKRDTTRRYFAGKFASSLFTQKYYSSYVGSAPVSVFLRVNSSNARKETWTSEYVIYNGQSLGKLRVLAPFPAKFSRAGLLSRPREMSSSRSDRSSEEVRRHSWRFRYYDEF